MPAPVALERDDRPTSKARPPRAGKTVAPITSNRVRLAEFMRNVHAVTVPSGVTVEDIQQGSYWVNTSRALKVTDRIEVINEDGSFFAELMVVSVVMSMVRVKLLRSVDLTDVEDIPTGDESELEVKYRGQIAKHTVQNKKTKKIIKEGFDTQAEAKQYLLNYETGLIK